MKLYLLLAVLCALYCGSSARTIVLTKNEEPVSVLSNDQNQPIVRHKRQFGFGPFGQSSALANANAFNNYHNPQGFGSSAALANAQSFNSQGPYGGFGASAANSGSQGFNCGYGGCSGNANQAGSQSYNLPGGKTLSLAYGGGFNYAPGQMPTFSNSNSLSYTR